jgi:hypothetical protein
MLNPAEGEIFKPNSFKQAGFILWKMLRWTFWGQNGILRKNASKMPQTGRSRSTRKGISGAEMSPDDQKRVLPFPWLYVNLCSDGDIPEFPFPQELTSETFIPRSCQT